MANTSKKRARAAEAARKQARAERFQRAQLAAGYAIIGLCLVISVVMALAGQLSPAVPLGLAVLAGIRLWALRREARRQGMAGAQGIKEGCP